MQKSGFFNALNNNGVYDRKYNANDYSDNLAVIISNGVLRSNNDDLRVTASGMVTTVAPGRAWINGHYYLNDTPLSFAAVTAPTGGTRYDRVFLRLNTDIAARSIELVYRQGTAANSPVKPAPVREGNIYELVLADIFIGTNATSVIVTDTRADTSLCGWVYSTSGDGSFFKTFDNSFEEWFDEKKDTLASVTLFKRYEWRTVTESAGNVFQFNVPQYDPETCFIEVLVNGIHESNGSDYILENNTITFAGNLIAGTEIEVKVFKSIDGTGIMSVADEITELQNAVAALNTTDEYEYICNGVDDNVKLSQIAQDWLDGGTDYGSKTIKVYGVFGATAAYAGAGTTTSPFRWFSVGADTTKNRKIIFDFSSCGAISLPIAAGTINTVFHGLNAHIIGANVICSQTAADTSVRMFASTAVTTYAENCRFWVTSYQDSRIANTGTFKNCRGSIANIISNSYCFQPYDAGLLRLYGGEYYAYTGASDARSAVVGQSATNAISILYGVNAPKIERSGFYQTDALMQFVGGGLMNCTDLVSDLPVTVTAGISNIRGTIALNKAGLM